MNWPIAVVLIVMIVAAAKVMNARHRARHGIIVDERGNESQLRQERDEAQEELAQLKERVKVLERIATDPARRTAEEIEKLRDD